MTSHNHSTRRKRSKTLTKHAPLLSNRRERSRKLLARRVLQKGTEAGRPGLFLESHLLRIHQFKYHVQLVNSPNSARGQVSSDYRIFANLVVQST